MQAELKAFLAFGLRRLACGLQHVLGDAIQLAGVGVVAKRVRGVQGVLAKALADLGQLLLKGGKSFALCALQLGPAEHKGAQGMA